MNHIYSCVYVCVSNVENVFESKTWKFQKFHNDLCKSCVITGNEGYLGAPAVVNNE